MALKPEQEINPENFVLFSDLFEQSFLDKVYESFAEHINQTPLNGYFVETIKEKFFKGNEWDNIQKRMNNHDMNRSIHETAQFVESNCYNVWYARKALNGHKFSYCEKVALLSFTLFHEYTNKSTDGEYSFNYVEQENIELRTEASETFVDIMFSEAVKQMVNDYTLLTSREALA